MSKYCPMCDTVTNCTDNCKSCLEEETMDEIITIGSNAYGEMLYRVYVGTGAAWYKVFQAYAYNEQGAVDLVADYCVEHELEGLYGDYYALADECEMGQSVDEYAKANGLICCGNNGIYMQICRVEEME